MNPDEVLASYLQQHPEDSLKWAEFLLPTRNTNQKAVSRDGISNLVNVLLEHMPEQDDSVSSDDEPEVAPQDEVVNLATVDIPMGGVDKALPLDWITRDGDTTRVEDVDPNLCNLCRQPYKESQATTTLLCGHKYHSQCWFLYEVHSSWCNVRQCHRSSVHVMEDVFEKKNKTKGDAAKTLIRHLKKKKEFQMDLKNLKTYCRDVTRAHRLIGLSIQGERADILEKHADSINAIQKDINDARDKISSGNEIKLYQKAVRLAKKESKNIFRKYHLDLRDLISHNLLKLSWQVRWAVQHHRAYNSYYKLGVRLYPGRKLYGMKSRSRLQRNIHEMSEDDDSENEV